MPTKKKHFYFLLSALGICCFILFDVYLAPTKSRHEVVINNELGYTHWRGRETKYCFLTTDKSIFRVTSSVYENINVGDTITVSRSIITSSIQRLTYSSAGNVYTSWGNIMYVNGSAFVVLGNALALIIWMLLYDFLKLLPARTNLTVFLCLITAGLLVIYIFSITPN